MDSRFGVDVSEAVLVSERFPGPVVPSVWILVLGRPVGLPWRFATASVGAYVLQYCETAFGGAHPPHAGAEPAIVRQVLSFVTTRAVPKPSQQLLYGR